MRSKDNLLMRETLTDALAARQPQPRIPNGEFAGAHASPLTKIKLAAPSVGTVKPH
jgi:hypothetical protein